jgi:aspartate/methionine/tyrosine aminotransferase
MLDGLLRKSRCVSRLDREGGWYAILRVPVTETDEDLAVALIERSSVIVHPGHFFNFSRDGFLILSLITVEGEFREGTRRLLDFLSARS